MSCVLVLSARALWCTVCSGGSRCPVCPSSGTTGSLPGWRLMSGIGSQNEHWLVVRRGGSSEASKETARRYHHACSTESLLSLQVTNPRYGLRLRYIQTYLRLPSPAPLWLLQPAGFFHPSCQRSASRCGTRQATTVSRVQTAPIAPSRRASVVEIFFKG